MTGFRAFAVALATFGLAACDEPFGWGRAEVDGEWIYQAEGIRGAGVRCEATDLRLLIDQDGNNFSGSVSGGLLTCLVTVIPEDTTRLPFDTTVYRSMSGVPITNGELSGEEIRFQIGAGGLRHDGEIVSRSMSGIVRLSGDLIDMDRIELQGSFAASRVILTTED